MGISGAPGGTIVGTSPEERLQTLLDATQRFSQSIDYDETMLNIVRFVAERFASYSLLDVVTEDARIERVAVAHGDSARASLVEAIRRFNPPAQLVATHPVARAIALGEATLERIDDAWIERAAISREHADTMYALEMRTLLVVPVTNARRVIGALTCALDRVAGRVDFDAGDVAFAEELARRAGLAIENAQLFEHERRIAFALQDESLPRRLPTSPALRLDASYRPARSEARIGGDWYDAFALDDGRIALTLGDVVGKGLLAAVTMGRVRQSMQAAAMLEPRAGAMLYVADRVLRLEDDARYATGIVAIFDPKTRNFEIASAGHPAPFVRHPGGEVARIDVKGMMLGVGAKPGSQRAVNVVLEPGAMLVLFTDGLSEFGRDSDAGETRIAEVLAGPAFCASARPARTLVDDVLGAEQATDDIAVLTAIVG